MNNIYMIPTEYNMQKSLTRQYEIVKRNFRKAVIQRDFYMTAFIVSLLFNIILIICAIDFGTKFYTIAGM